MSTALSAADLFGLFTHFLVLSLLAVGGAITTVPDMHRYIVVERHWISDAQFTSSIAIAQAAPGPNVLFVAVLGWNVAGPLGAFATMAGILLPSTVLSLWATRWVRAREDRRAVRAFKTGMAPVTLALLAATGWLLAAPWAEWRSLALTAAAALLVWRTRLHLLWLITAGALLGLLGWV